MLPHGEDMGLIFFIPSHLLDLPHLLAGLPDPPDDSLTLWLASQALQLASQTSGWPLRPLTGLSTLWLASQTLHMVSQTLRLIIWLALDPQILKLTSQNVNLASQTVQLASQTLWQTS